ncbi:Formate--tetrahydrofolate ligase [Trichinella pseudospiralis]
MQPTGSRTDTTENQVLNNVRNDLTVKSVSDTPIEARSGREPGIAAQEKFTSRPLSTSDRRQARNDREKRPITD